MTVVEHDETPGEMTAAISRGMVKLIAEYTGRGPTKARTVYGQDVVVITLAENLTRAEQRLVEGGRAQLVLDGRRAIQSVMQEEAVAMVQDLTGRTVTAFLSDNCVEPDVAVEVFLLDHEAPAV